MSNRCQGCQSCQFKQAKTMGKLKEVDSGYGVSLGRTIELSDEAEVALLEHQNSTGVVCWEKAAKGATVTEPEAAPVEVATEKPAKPNK